MVSGEEIKSEHEKIKIMIRRQTNGKEITVGKVCSGGVDATSF